jgi:predicted acylesterase/phospholipase RssA
MNNQTYKSTGNNRILVISGGGSRGAWGAGFAKHLTEQHGSYKVGFGTSTGSLMIPLIITNEFDKLEEGYTSVTQKDIFETNPFNKKGDLRMLHLLWRMVRGKSTLGETKNLRRLIERFLTPEIYGRIRDKENGLLFGVTVVNMRNAERTVKYSSEIADVAEMCDWMWASANQPLFMTYYPGRDNGFYVDGGVYDTIPIMPALNYAAAHPEIGEIDVIINQPKNPVLDLDHHPKTILKGLVRLTELWKSEVASDDLLIGLLAAHVQPSLLPENDVKINFHFFPSELYRDNINDLVFEKGRMKNLWAEGLRGNVETEEPGRPVSIALRKDVLHHFMQHNKRKEQEPTPAKARYKSAVLH